MAADTGCELETRLGNGPVLDLDGEFDARWHGAFILIEHWHVHRRLLRRCNIVLAPGEFSAILSAIRSGKAPLIERRADGRELYSVRIERLYERIYVLVTGTRIITAWPPQKRLNEIRRRLSAAQ